MDCCWTKAIRTVGWEFARPDSDRVLAFVYSARVSIRVEESFVGINPALSLEDIEKILKSPPDWMDFRKAWLSTKWPDKRIHERTDLELYGLTACKVLLAAGAKIPDGTSAEMTGELYRLFPQLRTAHQGTDLNYEAMNANVTIESNGQMQWACSTAAVGKAWPVPHQSTEPRTRSSFEVLLQNQLRIDIQNRIEAITT